MADRVRARRSPPLVFLLLVLLFPALASAGEPQCRLDAYGLTMGGDLTRLKGRIAARDDLSVVAMGSSSTAGAGASAPSFSYPAQLQIRLAHHWPHHRVRVINRGINGEEAADMMRRFGADILTAPPDLVIWQLGTNYLMRNEGVGRYAETLREGIDRLHIGRVDVVLMDPQYAPRVLADPDHDAIVKLIADVGRERHVPVFPRFRLMRAWAEEGAPWSRMLAPDMLHLNDWAYGCIAEALALEIVKLEDRTRAKR